jgi:hypothetical protein
MELRPDGEFLQWLSEVGIGVDPRYPDSGEFTFVSTPDLSRFWLPSQIPSDLPNFLLTACRTASGDAACWVHRRGGGFWHHGDHASSREEVIDRILAAVGLPPGAAGALRFDAGEWQSLLILLIAFYTLGWHVSNDLHVIPDNRSCVLMLGHHGELSCSCPDQRRLEAFIQAMAAEGFKLPDHVPDSTFKVPEWMSPGEGGAV